MTAYITVYDIVTSWQIEDEVAKKTLILCISINLMPFLQIGSKSIISGYNHIETGHYSCYLE